MNSEVSARSVQPDLKQIEAEALALSPEDRARLADRLLESLHSSPSEIEAAWADEVERRVAAFDRGGAASYSAESVFTDGRKLNQK